MERAKMERMEEVNGHTADGAMGVLKVSAGAAILGRFALDVEEGLAAGRLEACGQETPLVDAAV